MNYVVNFYVDYADSNKEYEVHAIYYDAPSKRK